MPLTFKNQKGKGRQGEKQLRDATLAEIWRDQTLSATQKPTCRAIPHSHPCTNLSKLLSAKIWNANRTTLSLLLCISCFLGRQNVSLLRDNCFCGSAGRGAGSLLRRKRFM